MATKAKSSLNITLLSDRVVIQVSADSEKEKKSASGIIIPISGSEERVDRGVVVAVGEGRTDKDGELVPMKVKVGDNVLFQWGDKVTVNGTQYYIVSESSILAITK